MVFFAYTKPFLRLKQKSYPNDAILFLILVKMNQHLKFELISPIKKQWLKQAKKNLECKHVYKIKWLFSDS